MDPVIWIVIIAVSGHVISLLIIATAGLIINITADEFIPHSCVGTNHQSIFAFMLDVIFVVLLGGI